MSTVGEGLRVGSAGVLHVQLIDGYDPENLSDYIVSAQAKYKDVVGAVAFTPTVVPDDPLTGRYELHFLDTQLTEASDLAIEFFFDGTPTKNPNSVPLIVPVRAVFAVAV